MASHLLTLHDVEQLKSAMSSLKSRLSETDSVDTLNLDEWISLVDEVFAGFYQTLYSVVMSNQSIKSLSTPPPLDSISHLDYIQDVIDIESASRKLCDILGNNTDLVRERVNFPNGEMGEVCFILGRALWHLADFQFPTRGRFPEIGKGLHLSIDGESVNIDRL